MNPCACWNLGGASVHRNSVVQITFGTYILPVLSTTLFCSILLFLLSAHLDFSLACVKIVEPLSLAVRRVEGLTSALAGLLNISVTYVSCQFSELLLYSALFCCFLF